MVAKLFWKSVIRRKGSLLLLMILIVTASFGFMLRAVEYLAVSREIDRIAQEYQQIGTLSSADGIVTEGVPLVEESPYGEFVDINRSCIAILSDIYNADVDGGIYYDWYSKYGININEFMVWAEVEAEVDEEIAGKLKTRMYYLRVKEGKTYLIRVFLDPFASMNQYGDRMTVGIRPLEEGVWFLESRMGRYPKST